MTATVDEHAGPDMETFDITGAFIHTETDKEVIMFVEVPLADTMMKVVPKIYCKCVIITSKVNPLLYIQIKKYHMLYFRVHYCFTQNMVKDLEAYGFQLNLYDPFVANKMIN